MTIMGETAKKKKRKIEKRKTKQERKRWKGGKEF